jgi:hypothetical protein
MENPTSTRNSDSLSATLFNSIQALGRGFDVTSDIRLLYCKGAPGSRLVHLDEQHTRDLVLSQQLVVPDVSLDIDFSNGTSGIHKTPVYSFQEVIVSFYFFLDFDFVFFLLLDMVISRRNEKISIFIYLLSYFFNSQMLGVSLLL